MTPDPHPARTPEVEVHAGPPPQRPHGAGRARVALLVAVAADALQLFLAPLFVAGAAAPWDDALDAAIGLVMVALLGWRLPFLPSFLAKLVPIVDLAPTWTAAVLFVTRGRGLWRPEEP